MTTALLEILLLVLALLAGSSPQAYEPDGSCTGCRRVKG